MEAEFKMYHQQGKEDQGLMAIIKNKEDNKFLFEVHAICATLLQQL